MSEHQNQQASDESGYCFFPVSKKSGRGTDQRNIGNNIGEMIEKYRQSPFLDANPFEKWKNYRLENNRI